MSGKRGRSYKRGGGLINSLISSLPFEAHLPGYRYCGPGTKLDKRLQRGDPGINPLDEACKQHDIAYAQHKDTPSRNLADRVLAEKAWKRVKSSDSTLGERIAARIVTAIMKGKVALGAGKRKKKGGFLPLIPIIAALGAAAGGAAQIATAVNKKKAADRQLAELSRHNREMEAKSGKGLKKRRKRRTGGFLADNLLMTPLTAVSKIVKSLKKTKGKGIKKRKSKNCGKGLYVYRKKP